MTRLVESVSRAAGAEFLDALRAPAVPLVVHDPYFSCWSFSDQLNTEWARHWTGAGNAMCIMARVEGKAYRLAGGPVDGAATQATPMKQTGVRVYPTRTVYSFESDDVEITLTFLTPAIASDLDLLSRPVTYVQLDAVSRSDKPVRAEFYFDVSGEWSVDALMQAVNWSRYRASGMSLLRISADEQRILSRAGDNLRIDWGHFYLAVPQQPGTTDALGGADALRDRFIGGQPLPVNDDLNMPRAARMGWPVMAARMDLGKVGREGASRFVMLAYDDVYSIEYMQRKMRPYWRRNGATIDQILQDAMTRVAEISEACAEFDAELLADLRAAGGDEYAALCSLAYRQCLGAHKLAADIDGTPLYFSKENFSNGCIATVDVTYPSAPLFLLLNPELLKAQITPVLDYACSPRWKFDFAPHDLGTYPLANGQVYGGGEFDEHDQMPVEECGNLLILAAALVKKNHDAEYAKKYRPVFKKWADYLRAKGLRPENQLCTDDFAGHLAGNANLAIKAVIGVAAYGLLARAAGDAAEAATYLAAAKEMAREWEALTADGAATPLVFDRSETWSQKYNLVWDKLLGLNLFSPAVAENEIAFYKKKMNAYGLPLDNRATYTKLDWLVWSATMATRAEDFAALIRPVFKWINETPTRVPMTDFYDTVSGKKIGFQARSVVGGMYIKLLADEARADKWARRVPVRVRVTL